MLPLNKICIKLLNRNKHAYREKQSHRTANEKQSLPSDH